MFYREDVSSNEVEISLAKKTIWISSRFEPAKGRAREQHDFKKCQKRGSESGNFHEEMLTLTEIRRFLNIPTECMLISR